MAAYHYEPLQFPDSIRLLLLLPSASRDDELLGSILSTTISEWEYDMIDTYTALSYVWGNSNKPCHILLNNNLVLSLTNSLDNALRDMRDATRVRRIWADALCIDQENIPERNRQVGLMHRIYSCAHNTVVYLGDLTADAYEVLAAAAAVPPAIAGSYASDIIIQLAIRDLISRPWFKRVWVFQELVLSRDPWVQCGNIRVRWANLCDLILGNLNNPNRQYKSFHKDLSLLEDMNSARNREGGFTLVEALKARRGLGASDPRDFVYANFGVANASSFQIDYDKSIQRVYGEAAKYMVCTLEIREVISYVDNVAAGDRLEGIPSWAPDWRHQASNLPALPRHGYKSQSRIELHDRNHPIFVEGDLPLVMGQIGYKADVVEIISGVIPAASESLYINGECTDDKIDPEVYSGTFSETILAASVQLFHQLQLLEQSALNSMSEAPGSVSFAAMFDRWGMERLGHRNVNKFIGSRIPGFLKEYFTRRDFRTPLVGRRLAMTQGGKLIIVPSQTRNGDIISYFAGNEMEVILRTVVTLRDQEIGEAVVQAFRENGSGTLSQSGAQSLGAFSRYYKKKPFEWRLPDTHVAVEHYSIVGEGLLDGDGGWIIGSSSAPKLRKRDLRVFALH